jgi:hypothetical protein
MIEWPTIPTSIKRRGPTCGGRAKVNTKMISGYEWTPPTHREAVEIMVSMRDSTNVNAGTSEERGSETPVQISPSPFSKEDGDSSKSTPSSPTGTDVYSLFEPPQSKFQHAARAEPTSVLVQQCQNTRSNSPALVMVHRVSMDCRPAAAVVGASAGAVRNPRKPAFRKFKPRPVVHHHQQYPPRQQIPTSRPPSQYHHLEALWRKLAMTMERSEATRVQFQRYTTNPRHGQALCNKTRHKLMSLAHRELENFSRQQQRQQQQQRQLVEQPRSAWNSSHDGAYRKVNMPGQWYHRH